MCMTATAIRIELAADLSTLSFINTFRIFLCSSGFRTRFIRTDYGSNFIGANNLLKAEMKTALADIRQSKYFQQNLQDWDLEWEFGPPEASHHGGLYERQLRTIRKAIDGLENLSIKKPNEDEFLTCCKLAEYIVNCRPLSKSPSDDGLPPLRPIDLMVDALDPRDDCTYPIATQPKDVLRRGH